MKFIADLHIHSHFSIATSKKLVPEQLDYWARLKGINVLGTGDCAHPGWLSELKEKLDPLDNGLFRLKPEYSLNDFPSRNHPEAPKEVLFMLTGEISGIYKKDGAVRKVHNLCLFPGIDQVERFQARLKKIGNIESDGRPILGLDSRDLLEIMLDSSPDSLLIPAHIWTPWFSALGSKSGFDTIKECYADLAPHITAVETGLSSDPAMNRACSFLDPYKLISNSDAHSPEKLGREANLFDTEMSYQGIVNALKEDNGLLGTIEFFCQQGKYHYDGHRKCGIRWDPLETVRHKGVCPKCERPVTRGVMYRVAELADRADISAAPDRNEFFSITPLSDLLAELLGKKSGATKSVRAEYAKLTQKLGPEFHILLFAGLDEIKKKGGETLAEGIRRLRAGEIFIEEGYDGEFGTIRVFGPKEGFPRNSGASLFPSPAPSGRPEAVRPYDSITFDIKAFQAINRDKRQGEETAEPPRTRSGESQEQREGITHLKGPLMVIAGPGSGKTHILTQRIIHLITQRDVPRETILALTFSNKAATEMEQRVRIKVPAFSGARTFHAFGLGVIKEQLESLGRSRPFYIVDDEEKKETVKKIVGTNRKEIKRGVNRIGAFKQGMDNSAGEALTRVYDMELKARNAFDLDDLIYLPALLFRENIQIVEQYKKRAAWLLIDEFQDINSRQYEMVRLLAGEGNPNLFVIGDPDQAIYGFRGSDVKFIEQIQDDYPSLKLIRLTRSYRCPGPYLKIAGQALKKKEFISGDQEDMRARIRSSETEWSEADWIAATIENMIGGVRSFSMDSGVSDGETSEGVDRFSDFAVLCRAKGMFGPIIRAFENHGIACQVVGTDPFYLEGPFRSALDIFKRACFNPMGLASEDRPIAERVGEMVSDKREIIEIISFLMEERSVSPEEIKRMEEFARPFGSDLQGFFLSLATRKGSDDLDHKREAVSLMTIHASKGLEFGAVFIPGCEEGIIPFELFGKKSEAGIREEERLFYVGVTRSKKYLFLSHAAKRTLNGRVLKQRRSPLLDRLERGLLLREKREPKKKEKKDSGQLALFGE